VLPEFLFGDLSRFFDSWLWIFAGKPVSLLSFFFWSGSCEILHLFFFFFSDPRPAITLAARYLRWRARVWIAGSAVRWWRFSRISENCLKPYEFRVNSASVWFCELNSMANLKFSCEIALNWCWIWARVHEFLWIFWWIWSVTAKREKMDSVGDVVLFFFFSFAFLTRAALCRLTCGPWTNWDVTCGLSWLVWHFGPICKFERK